MATYLVTNLIGEGIRVTADAISMSNTGDLTFTDRVSVEYAGGKIGSIDQIKQAFARGQWRTVIEVPGDPAEPANIPDLRGLPS